MPAKFDLRPLAPHVSKRRRSSSPERHDFICGPACAADFAEGIARRRELIVSEGCEDLTYYEEPERGLARGSTTKDS